MKIILTVILTLVGIQQLAMAQSQIPPLISYQGNLADATGTPLGAATPLERTVTFRIWKHPESTDPANRLYAESQVVTFVNGEFSILLGNGNPVSNEANVAPLADIWNHRDVFLGITVDDGDPATVDTELAPRQQIVTTAFAFRAKEAEVANTVKNGAIGSAQLANGAVTRDQLATDAIDGSKVASLSITQNEIAENSINSSKIQDKSITAYDLALNSVGSNEIIDGTIIWADMAVNAVGSREILDNTIGTIDIGDNQITSVKIADGQVMLHDLIWSVREALIPVGTILPFGGDNVPAGFILCDGRTLMRTGETAALFNAIGTRWGVGDGSTSFNVPDLRGVFLRGRDGGRGHDPDRGARYAVNGGATGDNVGSNQGSAFGRHQHVSGFAEGFSYDSRFGMTGPYPPSGGSAGSIDFDNTFHPSTSGEGGSTETRPVNVYVNYMIKWR